MFFWTWQQILDNIYEKVVSNVEVFAPKVIWALTVLFLGVFISMIIYNFVMYVFKRFKILNLIDRLESKMDLNIADNNILQDGDIEKKWVSKNEDKSENTWFVKVKKIKRKKITEKINVDILVAKAFSYYIFLIFFRYSIVILWINDVEVFLNDVLNYLPNLFIAICVWFFWVRFSNTVYDVVYYTLELTKHQTSRIIATWAKVIILFFTIMIVLNYIKIVDQFIINTIFVGFMSTVTIWAWIAFWLWWKDVAREILESFRK